MNDLSNTKIKSLEFDLKKELVNREKLEDQNEELSLL